VSFEAQQGDVSQACNSRGGRAETGHVTPRQRVLTALDHREPDRVPYNLRPAREMVDRLREEAGEVNFADYFGHDVRFVRLDMPPASERLPARDEWPSAPDKDAIAAAAAHTRELHERGLAVCGAYSCGVFEQAKHWLGDQEALLGPYEAPARFGRLLDAITEWKASIYCAYATAGVDIVWMGDDLGTQRSLVMSPGQYREWYRPRHRWIVERIRAVRSDVKIAFHCCGHVTPLIRDLIEIGVDVLEAVQPEAMDLMCLKREFGRDIGFWGGVGAQSLMARATPAQVIEGVRRTLAVMAPGGGYIAAPCHTLTPEVPWENVRAFHRAVREYGVYPDPGE